MVVCKPGLRDPNFELNKNQLPTKRGIYIYGAPGSGKTQFVYQILKDLTLKELTVDWVLAKIRNPNQKFDTLKSHLLSKLPVSEWSYRGKKGSKALLLEFRNTSNKDIQRVLSSFIKSRFNPARLSNGEDAVSKKFAFDLPTWNSKNKDEVTVKQLLGEKNDTYRSIGLFFARYGLIEYSSSAPLNFENLQPLFESPYRDVQDFFISCIEDSGDDYGYLDFYQTDSKGNDLYTMSGLTSYLNSANAKIRDIAIRMIQLHPSKFGKLEDLLHLVSSKDRRIREMVVLQIWKQFKDSGLTLHWKPFEESRVRQSPTARRRVSIRTSPRGDVTHVGDQKSMEWTIGEGLSPKESVTFDFGDDLTEFLRCIIFRLPPKTPRSAIADRLLNVIPAWKNKVYLIEAVTDVALQGNNVEFAQKVLPLLEELKSSKGKMEREATLVGIQKIRRAHQTL